MNGAKIFIMKRKMKIFLIVHQKTNFCILVDILLALIVVK